MIIREDETLPKTTKCDLLAVNRSTLYYQSTHSTPDPEEITLCRLLDEQHMKYPWMGSRSLRDQVNRSDEIDIIVNRKRVQRLMRMMGIHSTAPKPNTSKPGKQHKIYPYLLKNLRIDRPNQVWATDITYIPMAKGFLYLVAIMDWYSRKVLSWRLSNSLDTVFCIDALQEALSKYGTPEIFNTDQGSQFTSEEFTGILKDADIKISMDGKGRWMDNVFIERLWRSLKYEEVYLKAYETVAEARSGIGIWMTFYNHERTHQSLDRKTPEQVYFNHPTEKLVA
ncbi:MAG: IS3 family transposase [Methanobacteriota archaeon]|nr:MAG: IS3 family transposase [Euryarchaeota archaeon]